MYRKLSDIDISELSFVTKGANRKRYVIIKMDGTLEEVQKGDVIISIESDGSVKGTKVVVNGKEIKKVNDFNFSFYVPSASAGEVALENEKVNCSYTLDTGEKKGFNQTSSYRLAKKDEGVSNMLDKAKVILKEYFGEEVKLDVEKSNKEVENIEKSLKTVNEYKEEFPPELKDAVGIIAKHACASFDEDKSGTEKVEKKDGEPDKEKVEKTGKKFSKETLATISDIVSKLNTLLADSEGSVKKEDTKTKVENEKVEEVLKKVGELGKLVKKRNEESDELKKRLTEVEKIKGVKKGLEGQDDDEDEEGKDKVKKSGAFEWNSFKVKE